MSTTLPATQPLLNSVFLLCLLATGAGALIAVLSGRLIRAVSGLALCCLGLAGLFYFLHSPFLALMEILIYVGAVCVTIVFAVMLAEPDEPARRGGALWLGSLSTAVAAGILAALYHLGARHAWPEPQTLTSVGSVRDIGKSLLTTYSMAFELISLALLAAIVGALAIARAGRTKP